MQDADRGAGKCRRLVNDILRWVQFVPWIVAGLYGAHIYGIAMSSSGVPQEVRQQLSEGLRYIFVAVSVAFVFSIVVFVLSWGRRRKCSDPLVRRPEGAGAVELVAGDSQWCRRPESCTWAAIQDTLIAGAELEKAAALMCSRLARYNKEWNRESGIGALTTTDTYLQMAGEADADFARAYDCSLLTNRICMLTDGLKEQSAAIKGIIDDFKDDVLEELKNPNLPHQTRQYAAAESVAVLLDRTKQVENFLITWEQNARNKLISLQKQVTETDT